MHATRVDARYLGSDLEGVCLPRAGGVYVSGDGRRPLEITVRISEDARRQLRAKIFGEGLGAEEVRGTISHGASVSDALYVQLADRLQREELSLNSYEIRTCLEHLCSICSTKDNNLDSIVVTAVREIFDAVIKELEKFPPHPRLFRYGEFFPSQGAIELVSEAASYSIDSEKYCGGIPDTGRNLSARPLSLSYVKQVFHRVADAAHVTGRLLNRTASMSFLIHAAEDVMAKLAMLTGDGYERVPGTRLFTRYEKAISRVMIEHALLTSSSDELLETVKVGAVMVAIGGGVLSPEQLRGLGVSFDANSFGMEHDRQIQTGLRILNLVRQLCESDPFLKDVLQAYARTHFSVPGATPALAELCGAVWELREVLKRPLWADNDEKFRLLQSKLSRIIGNH